MSGHVTMYKFKDITVVPSATDLVDVVLSRTQRKTPTEVHKQFKISRIRNFYLRKIKFCQQTIHDKLDSIIQQFPRLDEIHPFYADLCNVLYDRDHYKLALGQCNAIKNVVDKIAKDYVRLMKYADSLYKCKMLKRAALGRMCTALKKLQSSFKYLEEVRQHLARLPSINPNSRTLIVCGYPNVGKSSFMNKVSHANVEVQPYAFTTKSLFVGHFDYAYSRFQVIDTPGVLDRPLEERNTIEMISVTALAHIHCAVLYFVDISETCGFSLDEQIRLYESIKPLFKNKPIILVVNKIDILPFESLKVEQQNQIMDLAKNDDAHLVFCSTLTADGVDIAKDKACSLLLEQRVTKKAESVRASSILNRLYITNVQNDINKRPPCIPESVILAKKKRELSIGKQDEEIDEEISQEKLERDIEEEMGGAGVYSVNLTKRYILAKDEWKDDILPEIWNGKNIADFVDVDIEKKLKMLEEEEQLLLQQEYEIDYADEKWEKSQNMLKKLHRKIGHQRLLNRIKKTKVSPPLAKKGSRLAEVEEHLKHLGYDSTNVKKRATHKILPLSGLARGRPLERKKNEASESISVNRNVEKKSKSSVNNNDDLDTSDSDDEKQRKLGRKASIRVKRRLRAFGLNTGEMNFFDEHNNDINMSIDDNDDDTDTNKCTARSRSKSRTAVCRARSTLSNKSASFNRNDKALPKLSQKIKAQRLMRASNRKRNMRGMIGEADRFIGTKMPKHLFSGKRGIGKADRR